MKKMNRQIASGTMVMSSARPTQVASICGQRHGGDDPRALAHRLGKRAADFFKQCGNDENVTFFMLVLLRDGCR